MRLSFICMLLGYFAFFRCQGAVSVQTAASSTTETFENKLHSEGDILDGAKIMLPSLPVHGKD